MFDIVTAATIVVYVGCCLALVFFVLLQKGEGGVGSALGGQAVDKALGTRASTAWRRLTAGLAALFLVLTVALGSLAQLHFQESGAEPPTATTRDR